MHRYYIMGVRPEEVIDLARQDPRLDIHQAWNASSVYLFRAPEDKNQLDNPLDNITDEFEEEPYSKALMDEAGAILVNDEIIGYAVGFVTDDIYDKSAIVSYLADKLNKEAIRATDDDPSWRLFKGNLRIVPMFKWDKIGAKSLLDRDIYKIAGSIDD